MPNLPLLRDGGNVFSLLRRQEFVLLDLTGSVSLPEVAQGLPVVAGSANPGDRALLSDLKTVLIRPDGHVAWASPQSLDDYLPENELRHWLNLSDDEPCLSRPRH